MNNIIFILQLMINFLFGVRVEGEPAQYPESGPSDVRGEDGFFEWCREYKVGCQSKSGTCYY